MHYRYLLPNRQHGGRIKIMWPATLRDIPLVHGWCGEYSDGRLGSWYDADELARALSACGVERTPQYLNDNFFRPRGKNGLPSNQEALVTARKQIEMELRS